MRSTGTSTMVLQGLLILVIAVASWMCKPCSSFGLAPFTYRCCTRTTRHLPLLMLAKKGGGSKDDKSDPDNWNVETDPLIAARFAVKRKVSNKQIKAILQENSITTIEELKNKSVCLVPCLKDDVLFEFIGYLIEACQRARKSIEETSGGGSSFKDERDPNNWNVETDPLIAARFAVLPSVSDEQIKTILQKNSITTIEELRKSWECLFDYMKKGVSSDFGKYLIEACQRAKKSIEETLGGETIYDKTLILPKSFEMFTDDAVSVSWADLSGVPDKLDARQILINLVLGSSGTGKSLFAVKRLPVLVFGGETSFFNIHINAKTAFNLMSENITFSEGVAQVVRKNLTDKLDSEKWTDVEVINLYLHVIIDEAGGKNWADFLNTVAKLESIVACIEKSILPRTFEGGVHVTVVGTGLDQITSKIKSMVEANKFRMLPWDLTNFEAFVKASKRQDTSLVLEVVRDYPVLRDLVTNARCAFHLFNSMDIFYLRNNRLRNFVNVLVFVVADIYIGSNALQSLKNPGEKWDVVRSVYKELDKATGQPNVPFFPDFNDLSTPGLVPIAACLLDVNVESINDELTFVQGDDQYAVSMSPALAIVMANLLNTQTEITWNRQGLGLAVTLSELKRMVATSQSDSQHMDRLVFEMQHPVIRSNTSFSFPLVDNTTIILNGAGESYANVIAPYRLVRVMSSKYDSKSSATTLNLKAELDEIGLTNSSHHWIQQNLTRTIYAMWSAPRHIFAERKGRPRLLKSTNRLECYPMSTLSVGREFEELAMIVGRLSREGPFGIQGKGISARDVHKDFDKSRPVTAVFVTNSKSFRLSNTELTINDSDVDWEGKLKSKELPEDLFWAKNVEIRFLFF